MFAQRSSSSNPNLGIGVRLGDPTGLTVKKYMGRNALEFNIGRTYMFSGGSRYYNRRFDDWYDDWHRNYPHYRELEYVGYSRSVPISMQLHYLFHRDIKEVENLQWYWGLGAQLRIQKYKYKYRYKLDGSPYWYYEEEGVTDLDVGVDGVLGVEYRIPTLPVSVFADIDLFMEVADNPFAFWFQGGLGARYNF
ncbi:MAG TPA: hypothetical protein VL947_13760 [Cytophagales bacterium]|nr:hypothetical protein [Cytophagales bacterium]